MRGFHENLTACLHATFSFFIVKGSTRVHVHIYCLPDAHEQLARSLFATIRTKRHRTTQQVKIGEKPSSQCSFALSQVSSFTNSIAEVEFGYPFSIRYFVERPHSALSMQPAVHSSSNMKIFQQSRTHPCDSDWLLSYRDQCFASAAWSSSCIQIRAQNRPI